MSFGNMIRYGKNGTSGDPFDMWLPVYGGEVLAAFEEKNQFLDKVTYRTIASGNTAKFPAVWKMGSEYHEAGTELLGLDVETDEFTITLDDRPLVAHYAFDDVDDMMSHYDVRSMIAQEAGRELSRTLDKNIAIMLILAARTAATGSFPGGFRAGTRQPTGYADLRKQDRDGAVAVLNAIEDARVAFDENNVPEEDTYCAVPPGLWLAIKNLGVPRTASEVTSGVRPVYGNNDWNPAGQKIDQMGDWGHMLEFNGVKIFKTNHLPGTVSSRVFTGSTISNGPTRYQGTFTNTGGIIFQKQALAAILAAGVSVETDRDVRRQQDFFVTKMHMGGGTLRPVAAYELNTA